MHLQKSSYLLGLSIAVPEFCIPQEVYANFACNALHLSGKHETFVRAVCDRSAIKQRYFVVPDPLKDRSNWTFLPPDYPKHVPTTTDRARLYQREAPKLAYQASLRALEQWGQDKKSITHVISISCTGAIAPGLEFLLIDDLGLSRSVQRFGLNFMGCFGAIRGLAIAHALAQENPKNRILMVCTELCSLHFQADLVPHHFIANALFADGAAAVIIGDEPSSYEKPIWKFVKFQACALENTRGDMTWDLSDHGFVMYLSVRIPELLAQQLGSFIQDLVGPEISLTESSWAIHPGGKAIIQGIETVCQLERWQTQTSWDVLASYGNMSSSTILFVLDQLARGKKIAPWTIALAFGPGLSLEGLLLEHVNRVI